MSGVRDDLAAALLAKVIPMRSGTKKFTVQSLLGDSTQQPSSSTLDRVAGDVRTGMGNRGVNVKITVEGSTTFKVVKS